MGIVGVKIITIDPKRVDQRGAVYEQFELNGIGYPHYTLYYRSLDARSSYHFHKGDNKSKDPEILLVLSGGLELIARNMFGELLTEVVTNHGLNSNGVGIPAIIIDKNVCHQTISRSPDLIIMELWMEKFDPNFKDIYPKSEFDKLYKITI